MITAVVFDLDGTLVSFTLDVKACRTEVIQTLIEEGFSPSLFSFKITAFEMLEKVKEHLTKQVIQKKKFLDIKKTVHAIVESYELKAAKKTKIFPGIHETLKTLRRMNMKIGLCTINSKKATKYIIDHFGLAEFFDSVVPREAVSAVKPDSSHLEAVIEALKVEANNVVLVGDSIKDVVCANRFNVLAVGVSSGISSKQKLIDAGVN